MLTDTQVDEMLAAARGPRLWTELGDMLEHLGPTERPTGSPSGSPRRRGPVRAAFEAGRRAGELDAAGVTARLAGS